MSLPRPLEISAPSRLHFGLFSVGTATARRFGGVGLMIQSPRTRITIQPAERLTVGPREHETIQRHTIRWFENYGTLLPDYAQADELPCEIELTEQPRRHAGFGSGTQLALAVGSGLLRFFGLPMAKPTELAPAMGRGQRSAIGSHGFFHGGLLVDRGRSDPHPISPLDFQMPFPSDWPIVLATYHRPEAISGKEEASAFSKLPDATPQQTKSLIDLVNQKLIPAVTCRDYPTFAESVYTLSHQSGLFFQTIQGGPYNGRDIEQLVGAIQDFGVPAVGQSSWGPCVFAVAPDPGTAKRLQTQIAESYGVRCETQIVSADNTGVQHQLV